MRVPVLLTMAWAAAALAGCATHSAPKEPPQLGATAVIPGTTPLCAVNSNNTLGCVIELTVSNPDNPLDIKGCVIKLKVEDNDLLTVKGMEGQYIYWRIVDSDSDYQFTRDGIAFIDNFRPRMFDEGERTDDKKGYQWLVVDGKRRVNGYVINIRKAGSQRRCELDPWVRSK